MLRVYGSDDFASKVCEVIRADQLPLKVMVGAWVTTITGEEAATANERQVDGAIALANEFPDVVAAVSIGNESQVFWSFHKLKTEKLIEYIRQARKQTKVPVTVADDFLFWTAEESQPVADEIDFIVTHIYAMWHAQQLDAAIAFTKEKLAEVQAKHPNKLIVLGEAGWATDKPARAIRRDACWAWLGKTNKRVSTPIFALGPRNSGFPTSISRHSTRTGRGATTPTTPKNTGVSIAQIGHPKKRSQKHQRLPARTN